MSGVVKDPRFSKLHNDPVRLNVHMIFCYSAIVAFRLANRVSAFPSQSVLVLPALSISMTAALCSPAA